MGERERQLDRTADTDEFELELGSDDSTAEPDARGGLRGRLGTIVTTRELIGAFLTTVLGLVFVGGFLPLALVGGLVGVFAGGFAYGVGASSRPYLPLAVAGGIATAVWQVLNNIALTLLGPGVPLAAIALVGGALAAVVGGYFGRDLRHGLTRDLGEDRPR